MARWSVVLVLAAVVAGAVATAGSSGVRPLSFRVYADTGIRLTDVLWDGRRFLYLENTANTLWQAPPAGAPPTRLASMPHEVEETRCALSPGAHGFPAGGLYCHAPDNTIYRIAADGSSIDVVAHLPETAVSDGALAFDDVGTFGYALLAATGRSGGGQAGGGTVYAVGADGGVRPVGSYAGPGGADEIAVAPARFGSAGGDVVLTVDAGATGTIVLMDAHGRTRTIASLPGGPNPVAVVRTGTGHARTSPPPGLYVTDTNSHDVFLAPAAQLARYAGDLVVGAETKPLFWIVRPRGRGFRTFAVPATIPGTNLNLEGAVYLPG
jgi:hypothetical protein